MTVAGPTEDSRACSVIFIQSKLAMSSHPAECDILIIKIQLFTDSLRIIACALFDGSMDCYSPGDQDILGSNHSLIEVVRTRRTEVVRIRRAVAM